MVGFKTGQEFGVRAQEKLAQRDVPADGVAAAAEQLAGIGVDISPAAAPLGHGREGIAGFDMLSEADKAAIRDSASPLMTLWGLTGLRRREYRETHPPMTSAKTEYMRRQADPTRLDHELAILGSLGLVHSTSLEGLMGALERGAFVPNREISDDRQGNTLHTDRDLGLDGYVFADYGRPHAYRRHFPAPVEVVFDLTAMHQPGSFATEQDIADTSLPKYMQTIAEPDYFLEAVQLKLSQTVAAIPGNDIIFGTKLDAKQFADGVDGDPNTLGTNNFSTWEVKMPVVGTDKIKKLIFRSEAAFAAFQERYGDAFPAEFVAPDKIPQYYDEQDVAANEIKLAEARAQAFHEVMSAQLAALPAEDKEVVYAAVQPSYKTAEIRLEQDFGSLAYLEAATEEALQELVRAKRGQAPHPLLQEGAAPFPITNDEGQYTVIQVERAKGKHHLRRLLGDPRLATY